MLHITDIEFEKLAFLIKNNCGVYLKAQKKPLVISRLHSILAENNFTSFSQYYNYILSDHSGEAVVNLINKITTNHTFFMREFEHFNYMMRTVLPYLAEKHKKEKDLAIWSAGCSTGQEPYTIAMLLNDFFGEQKKVWDTRILATDISTEALEEAKKGKYSIESLNSLPDLWKKKYFSRLNNEYSSIISSVKDEVIFRKFNLMNEFFPFKKKFQVIFCRNVMIYFDQQTKKRLIEKFYEVTEPGGYLFIGQSESLVHEKTRYRYIMPAVYRKD